MALHNNPQQNKTGEPTLRQFEPLEHKTLKQAYMPHYAPRRRQLRALRTLGCADCAMQQASLWPNHNRLTTSTHMYYPILWSSGRKAMGWSPHQTKQRLPTKTRLSPPPNQGSRRRNGAKDDQTPLNPRFIICDMSRASIPH